MPIKTKDVPHEELEKMVPPHPRRMSSPTLLGSGMHINPTPLICQPDQKTNVGQVIRALRKDRGISQEELARRAQVDRTTIVRIECGIFKSMSVERLERIAAAVGIDSKSLLRKTEPSFEAVSFRGSLNQITFSLDYPDDGFKIISLTPKRREFFFGRIEIEPHVTVASPKLPHPEQLYLHCLDGKLLLTSQARESLLKPGDCFIFSGFSDYEFYNPDGLKKASSLFVTYPSFLLT